MKIKVFGLSGGSQPTFSVLCFMLLFPVLCAVFSQENSEDMPHHEVERWAQMIGNHIFHLLNIVAKYSEIEENFSNQQATITDNDGLALVKQMAEDVTNMMKYKIQAVKRIMNVAEEVSQDPSYLQDEWKGYYNSKIINQNDEFFERLEERYRDKIYEYYGSKYKEQYRHLDLTPNAHFDGIPITLNLSTVHVPTNVFEGGPAVKTAIRWSEALEKTFYSNYEHDPSLSWQYFGSSTGFLRQFPGSAWQMDKEDPDLFDARLRAWYISAANSPKDVIILLDVSGSMTGIRKKIAKHVVLNILETLTDNDFLNIFTFSENTTALVKCFNDTLVQANLENLGEFKQRLDHIETENIANFSLALTTAFKLLQKFHKNGHAAHCNQAIMLITDGAPYTYENIFDEFNWPHLQIRLFTYLIGREVTEMRSLKWMACANKGYFVHVTTASEVREQVLKYIPVVARPMVMYGSKHPVTWTGAYADIADPKQTNWLWELRERDRQMRRTNNYRKLKKVSESADNKKLEWALRDKNEVEKFLQYGEFGLSDREVARIKAERARKIRGRRENPGAKHGYRMVTTVSVPVYNRTQKENITERILINESVWVLRSREKIVADLLGVAATDVPIREIEKLVPAYKLGVNGYSFVVNNNGYVLYHPDLRPTHEDFSSEVFRVSKDDRRWFQDILKPNYNSVDLTEVELIDYSDEPRQNYSELNTSLTFVDSLPENVTELGLDYDSFYSLPFVQENFTEGYNFSDGNFTGFYNSSDGNFTDANFTEIPLAVHFQLRRDMIEQRGSETNFRVRAHLDNMKRVEIREQKYYTAKIADTPFSLGLAMPQKYGKYKIVGEIELSLAMKDNVNFNASSYFNTGSWSLHPDWVYCEYKYDQGVERTPEELLLHFLAKAQMPGWKWRSTRTRPPPESSSTSRGHQSHYDENDYFCDKTLVQSLLFDAKATDVYNKTQTKNNNFDARNKNQGGHKNFGITTAFVSTRSGLTRWIDIDEAAEGQSDPHFMHVNNKAIDEVWYKRAVDYYREDSEAYVYSVPFDAATRDPSKVLVTASRAIFIRQNKYQQAPVAVVGVNIKLDKFMEFFQNETYNCREYARQTTCKKDMTCKSEFLDCYLLDDNGFVVASEQFDHTGRFFGEIEGTIMESLVQSEVYNRIKIYDYQAVCLDPTRDASLASILLTPIQLIKWTAQWIMSNVMWVLLKTHIYHMWDPNMAWAYSDYAPSGESPVYPEYDTQNPIDPITLDDVVTDGNVNNMNGAKNAKVIRQDGDVGEKSLQHKLEYNVENVNANKTEGFGNATHLEIVSNDSYHGDGRHDNATIPDDLEYEEEIDHHDYDINEGDDWNEPPLEETDPFPNLDLAYINKTRPRPCDKEVDLYKLNNTKLKETNSDKYRPVKGKLSNCHTNGCGRPFSVQKVVKTNLVLIVVHNLCPCESKTINIEPKEVEYTDASHCERLLTQNFRKRPSCSNYHPDETSITDCGGCSRIYVSSALLLMLTVMHAFNHGVLGT